MKRVEEPVFGGDKPYTEADASHDFETAVTVGGSESDTHHPKEGLLEEVIEEVRDQPVKPKSSKKHKAKSGTGSNQPKDTFVRLDDLDEAPLSFQARGMRTSHSTMGSSDRNFELSLIEEILHHYTTTPPITIKQILLQGPNEWPRPIKVILNLVKLLVNAGIPIGAAILYANGAIKFANGDYSWAAIYLTCAIGSNVLQNALYVQETFASFLSENERRLIGDNRPGWRRNLPLIGYITASNFPAASSTLSFIVTSTAPPALRAFLALVTQGANAFMYTFGLRSIASGLQNTVIRSWHFKNFPFCWFRQSESSKDMCANYQLQDRLISFLEGVQANIIRNRDRHNFPANLLPLTAQHNDDWLDRPRERIFTMGILTALAKARGVIDVIAHPDYERSRIIDGRINTAASVCGLSGSVLVGLGIVGFFYATETGLAQIAADVDWLAWLGIPAIKYSIAATIDLILGGYLCRAGHSLMTTVFKNLFNLFRGKVELPWVMQMYPVTTTTFVIVTGGALASFSYATGVLLINSIPEGYQLLGFIPLSATTLKVCSYSAYGGVAAANGFFNFVTLAKILEALVARLSCSPSERLYAQLARAIDQAIALIKQMDPRGTFGDEFSKLINIPTHTEHFERENRVPARQARPTTVYDDLTVHMDHPNILVHRASGARRAAADENVPLRGRHVGTLFARGINHEDAMEEMDPPRPARNSCCTIL